MEDRAINAGQGAIGWIMKSWNPLAHTAYGLTNLRWGRKFMAKAVPPAVSEFA